MSQKSWLRRWRNRSATNESKPAAQPRRRLNLETLEMRVVPVRTILPFDNDGGGNRNGLVAAFSFSEGSGTVLGDNSGNGSTGTISNANWTTNGKFGSALNFNGSSSMVTIADANHFDLTNGMTIEAWVRPTSINGWETVVLKESSDDLAYALYADNNGNDAGQPRRPNVSIRQGDTTYMANGSSQLPINTWTHLAATYDGSVLREYVNGALSGSTTQSGSINTSSGALRIGGNTIWNEWFNGRIDEVRIYNRALGQSEIQTDMNTAITPASPYPSASFSVTPANEGGTAQVSFANAAGGSGSYRYSFDYDANGTFDVIDSTSAMANIPANFLSDGPASRMVRGRISDASTGLFSLYVATLTIANVAPSVQINGPSNGAPGTALSFSANVTDPSPVDTAAGFSYLWNFGDGTATSAAAAPTHVFASAGTYTVTLGVTDRNGGLAATTLVVGVSAGTPPTAIFTGGNVNEGSTGQVAFTNATGGSGGYRYSFDFDNNGTFEVVDSTSSAATVASSYLSDGPGSRVVRGRIKDSSGFYTDYTAPINIANVTPSATLAGPYSGVPGTPISFAANVTDPSPVDTNAGFTYAWNFGDGSTSTQASPSHAYAATGTFTVTLMVTDKDGGSAQVTGSAVVSTTSGNTLANVGLTTGWATFGQVLPQGAARTGLQLGTLATQTDIKTTWPDGSIRYAIVSANVTSAGTYALREAPASTGTVTAALPNANVQLTIGGTIYTATLPATSTDVWLSGPLVSEKRFYVTPLSPTGAAHPFLRVLFDVRTYSGGANRLDVTVENTLDVAGATSVSYSVDVVANGQTVYHHNSFMQYYMTRWRKVFGLGLTESQETLDFAPFYQANAVPRYLSQVSNVTLSSTGANFDLMKSGDLNPTMSAPGGRPEIGPYPDWAARYLVYQSSGQRNTVLANGDLAGSWPIHIRQAAGGTYQGVGSMRLVSIDERPNFWLDPRATADNKPLGTPLMMAEYGGGSPAQGQSPLTPSNSHMPSLAYIPYLTTGDRYYADEMAYWANEHLLITPLRDSQGLLSAYNEIRGMGWTLRNLADAAAYLPTADPVRIYLAQKLQNNLNWFDNYAANHNNPLGTVFEDYRPENTHQAGSPMYIALWEQSYLAWALDHATLQGFQGGTGVRDKVVAFQNKLFNSGSAFPRQDAAPYVIPVATWNSNGSMTPYTTISQAYAGTTTRPFQGYYGPDARLLLMIARRLGMSGADSAYTYLFDFIGNQIYVNGVSDLANRAGWAIAYPGEQ